MNDLTSSFAPDGEWADELTELQTRRRQSAAMGGADALARMKAMGRMNARERIVKLLDDGSFRELGRIAGKARYDEAGRFVEQTPVNAIMGTGKVAPSGRHRIGVRGHLGQGGPGWPCDEGDHEQRGAGSEEQAAASRLVVVVGLHRS